MDDEYRSDGGSISNENYLKQKPNTHSRVVSENENERSPNNHAAIKLKKTISLFSAIAILVANTGGASVFIGSTSILRYAGSPGLALIFWFIGGFVNFGLAFCFVEVALIFPKAGGPYYYIKQVFGPFVSFVFLWGFLLSICGPAWALGSYTSAIYITTLIFPDCPPPELGTKMLAATIMVALVVLNCLYMKYITRVQSLLSAGKLVAMIIIILAGLSSAGSSTSKDNLSSLFRGTTTDPGSVALGLAAGYFSYGGWQMITIIIEEVEKPLKNVPRSLIITFFTLIFLYMSVNLCYFIVLSPQKVLQTNAVAILFAYHFHPAMAVAISLLVSVCAVSGLNSLILGQPRIVYAAGKGGHMPILTAMINTKYLTPWPATILMSIPALWLLFSGTVLSLIDTMGMFSNVLVISVLLCLLRLRWTHPFIQRKFKVPIILPVFELMVSVTVLVMSVIKKPRELGICLMIVAAGIPVYIIFIGWKTKPKCFTSFSRRCTSYLQILFSLVKPES